MASSLFTNTLHVCFDSVLSMDNPGVVSMFEALMASSLSGFLGCPSVLYEDALTEFFLNGSVRDGKFLRVRIMAQIIARSNTNIKSTCWIRTMLRINGTWVIEPCADYWQLIPRVVASSIVVIPSRLSYVDTLPPVSEFFKLLKKRAIAVVQPVSVFGFQRPTVTSWVWSQLCTAFVRSVLRDVQLVTHSISVAPSVQTSITSVFAPDVQFITSSDSSADSSLHFNANDISTESYAALDQSILPSSAADISASLAALRESFSKLVANQTRDSRCQASCSHQR
ncbi:zinc finger protein CONSTANS-LIKE 15-like [Dorcoceras hygrometricum]|uniref:Zinc finger protein CONSTANS-LIKE 15-like n=1 Tax=Dorcoceras hygrometricum TaxID=472368 RepID=A0A2Z7AT21_9LAMI|nr:zinc finger protein CONSTANS-LIKE 15-like [Dorcoceras hygrometricum]